MAILAAISLVSKYLLSWFSLFFLRLVFIPMRLLLSLLLYTVFVHAQLVQFQQPYSGQLLGNGDTVMLSWTIVGQQAGM
jgi:hypothetical protein